MSDETVTISVQEYNSMNEELEWLRALEAAGVDSWEGIEEARDLLENSE